MNHTPYLQAALAQAKLGRGNCSPNPAVGAVLVKDGEVIAQGFHRGVGTAHAEVDALSSIDDATNTTLYVTLEPCCHQGHTPPCTDLIVQKNIPHVVFGFKDPMRHLDTCGEDVLKNAGVRCEHVPLPDIDAFYQSFVKFAKTRRPFVTAKLAISVDGKTAGANAEPIKITGSVLSSFTHDCRKASDAILTTVKTVMNDDPQLNARTTEGIFKKPIYIVDANLTLARDSRLFETAKNITVFYDEACEKQTSMNLPVTYVPVKRDSKGLSCEAMLAYLGDQGVHDVWIEAGGTFFSSMIKKGLVDRAYLYVAPKILGDHAHPAFMNVPSLFATAKEKKWQVMGGDVMCVMGWE